MFDAKIRPWIDPPLDKLADALRSSGLTANAITIAGFVIGLGAMVAIATGYFLTAFVLLAINRIADGLDGALARRLGPTDLGGYLDIVLDFIFYSGIVFAFAVYDAEQNALAAAFLIFSFIGTGCSFLAFAIVAAKRKMTTSARGQKSIYYLGGLTEGAETITLLLALCVWPLAFPVLAWIFGAMCWLTTLTRIAMAKDAFGENNQHQL